MKKMFALALYVFSFCVANTLTAATYFPPCQASFGTIINPNQQVLCAGSSNTELFLADDAAFPYTTLYLLVDDDAGIVRAMQPNSIFALADAAAGSYHIYPINLLAEQLPNLYNLVQTSSTPINTLDTMLQNNSVCFALDTVGVGIEVLAPLGWFIDEECEFDLDEFVLTVTFFGGYPQYTPDSTYTLSGTFNGEVAYGDTIIQAFADGSLYYIVLTTGGCNEALTVEGGNKYCQLCYNYVSLLSDVDTSTICNGIISIDAIDEEVEYESILVYVLHNTPPLFATSDTLSNVLAINSSGVFDLNNVPNLVEGATYYLSAVAGQDEDENGVIDNYTDGCTVVSESKQFVYHTNCDPIGIDTPTHLGALQLQLSPVPAHNVLQIAYVATQKSTINAVVYDALGSVLDVFYVVANEGKGTYALAIDSYASGVYFVRLNDSQYSAVAKFVKK